MNFRMESIARRATFLLLFGLLPLSVWSANYVNTIDSREIFEEITIKENFSDNLLRTGKFLVPATDDPNLVPTAFQNVNVYGMHMEFMATEFPDDFPFMTPERYMELVERRAGRKYWAGLIHELVADNTGPRFGFTIFTDPSSSAELPTQNEVAELFTRLNQNFTIGELCYIPDSEEARKAALEWQDSPFCTIFLESEESNYEGYSVGIAYGHVRLLTTVQAEDQSAAGLLSWQDIVVIDGVPRFLESVVSAIITGGRQGELSHVNVRAARRGTPNAYIKDPFKVFAPFEGQLVRVRMDTVTYEGPVVATEAEAEEWWNSHRPKLNPPPPPDLEWTEFTSLAEMGENLSELKNRFGAKASNLSILFRSIPEQYRLPAFAIPYHYYDEFMKNNIILDRSYTPPRPITCRAYLDKLLNDPEFNSNSELRSTLLLDFKDDLRHETFVDPELVRSLAARIEEIFGSTSILVRFRSSSNMEDDLAFNGAGLYDSTAACAYDSLDNDNNGPCFCDPARSSERTIERALRKVWASLWNPRAFEERAYYQLPQDIAAMGILVSPAFIDEAANGVAFSGNPLDVDDKRFLINVQYGDASVVLPDPDVIPERDYLTMADGQVTQIHRASPSSIVPEGSLVLTDEQLKKLGAVMAIAQENFHVDPGTYDPARILLDFEFKFLRDGSLVFKQVRPFLIGETGPEVEKDYRLVIPEGTEAAGVYKLKRPINVEQELLSYLVFKPGTYKLDVNKTGFPGDLIEKIWICGPDQEATPTGAGEFQLAVYIDTNDQSRTYKFSYTQTFEAACGTFKVTINDLDFDDEKEAQDLTFDEQYMSYSAEGQEGLNMQAVLTADPDDYYKKIQFGSVGYKALPLHLVKVEGEGGKEKVEIDYRRLRIWRAYGPANLVGARIWINDGYQEINDYWHLVYSALIHNTDQRFRALLDPPLGNVYAVEIREPYEDTRPPRFILLDSQMEEIRRIPVSNYVDTIVFDSRSEPFLRGDANGDGRFSISDAVTILLYATGNIERPSCMLALDVNDDDQIAIDDAISLLGYMFGGDAAPPEPFYACGMDSTPDDHDDSPTCEDFPACDN